MNDATLGSDTGVEVCEDCSGDAVLCVVGDAPAMATVGDGGTILAGPGLGAIEFVRCRTDGGCPWLLPVRERMPTGGYLIFSFSFSLADGDTDAFVLSDTQTDGIHVECTTVSACARGLYT